MKSFTDIKQSKKLAEFLSHESADMWYWEWPTAPQYNNYERPMPHKGEGIVNVPCWSLASLLDIFPCSKESPIVNLTRGGWNPSFTRRWFATWEDENKNILYSCDGISPVDAVVELIFKLHEQKLL